MLMENGHMNEGHMILKIDIEGAEYDVLNQIESDVLRRFSQIVFEFHNLTDMDMGKSICQAVGKLNSTHQLVHVHANNYRTYLAMGGSVLPELMECTYLSREEYAFRPLSPERDLLPLPQDKVNNICFPEIFLGGWDMDANR